VRDPALTDKLPFRNVVQELTICESVPSNEASTPERVVRLGSMIALPPVSLMPKLFGLVRFVRPERSTVPPL
jgi:hypothetical protein